MVESAPVSSRAKTGSPVCRIGMPAGVPEFAATIKRTVCIQSRLNQNSGVHLRTVAARFIPARAALPAHQMKEAIMGQLVDGIWHDEWYDTKSSGGKFVRSTAGFRNWITPRRRSRTKRRRRLSGRKRTLSSLCQLGMPLGASHVDLPRDQRSDRPHLGQCGTPRHALERVGAAGGFPGRHRRRPLWAALPSRYLPSREARRFGAGNRAGALGQAA